MSFDQCDSKMKIVMFTELKDNTYKIHNMRDYGMNWNLKLFAQTTYYYMHFEYNIQIHTQNKSTFIIKQ